MHAINYTKAVGESDPIREINLFKSSKNEMNSGRLLKDACHYELDFLERIDRDGHLYYDEKYLEISIMRYEKYWLPLLASLSSSSSEDLKVPLFLYITMIFVILNGKVVFACSDPKMTRVPCSCAKT